jgi:alanyl-tRNA synthetase
MRIVADHSRAVTFMIGDGVLPANEGRGYVLRRLLRRAMRHGQLLGINPPFLGHFVKAVIAEMGPVYPELNENSILIERLIGAEEERFAQTLRQGQSYLDQHLIRLRPGSGVGSAGGSDSVGGSDSTSASGSAGVSGSTNDADFVSSADSADGASSADGVSSTNGAGSTNSADGAESVLSGATAFELHDRFGFPIDLTVEIAGEQGVEVDRETFERHMAEQRERARAHAKDDAWAAFQGIYASIAHEQGRTHFLGYTQHSLHARVVAIVANGESVSRVSDGQLAQVFLDRTPFYAEMGGQVGDIGLLTVSSGNDQPTGRESSFTVEDTQVFEGTLYAHIGRADGSLAVG